MATKQGLRSGTPVEKAKEIRKTDLETKARQYLERACRAGNGEAKAAPRVTKAAFNRLVKREVMQTMQQLRAMGHKIVD